MIKKVLIVIISFIILITCLITISLINKQNLSIKKIYESVVYVKGEDENTSREGCGIVYEVLNEKAYILTNYHIIEGYYSITIKNINNEEVAGKVVYFDDKNDIALIEVNNSLNLKKCKLGDSSNISSGYSLKTIVVNEKGKYDYIGLGKVTDYINMNDYDMNFYVLKTNIKIKYGNSGCALFNSKNEVVGMIFLKDDSTDAALAIPINFIIKNISEGSNKKTNLGGSFASVSDKETLNDYGISSNLLNGVIIVNIDINGLLYKNGLKKGDIIVEIDNKKINNVEELKNEINNIMYHDFVKIKYYRDGNYDEIYLSLIK